MGEGEGLLGFYNAIVKSCASLFSHGPDVPTHHRAAWKGQVRAAIEKAQCGPSRAPSDLQRYRSDKFLEQLLRSYAGKERAKALRVVGVPDPEPDEYAPELPPLIAKERLQVAIRGWMTRAREHGDGSTPEQLLVKGAAGLGKTTCAIDALSALPQLAHMNVEFYVPTKALGAELVGKLRDAIGDTAPVDIIRGRGAESDGEPMCKRAPLADAMGEAGWDVTKYLCEGVRDDADFKQPCPHRETCPYLAQFGYQGPQVRVLTHGHLKTRHRMRLPDPDLTIVDESFHKDGIRKEKLPLAELYTSRGLFLPTDAALDEVCRLIGDTLTQRRPLLAALREWGATPELLRMLSGRIFPRKRSLNSFVSDEQAAEALKAEAPDFSSAIIRMLGYLADEIGLLRDESNAVTGRGDKVHLASHLKLPLADRDVLLLDASADPDVAKVFLPHLKVLDLPVARRAFVTQVQDKPFSKASLLNVNGAPLTQPIPALSLLNLVQVVIDREASAGRRVLVVAPKKIAELLRAPKGGAIEHFNNLRGKDGYKDFDEVVIVSRELPPIAEIEDMARGLWSDHPDLVAPAKEWQTVQRAYRTRSGELQHGLVQGHPDRRVDRLLRTIREGEIEQAVDRLRLVHAEAPKRVLLLTNTPTGIVVDEFTPWGELEPSRVEVAFIQTGFAPLSAPECVRIRPDLWPTQEAAKKGLQRDRDRDEGDNPFYSISYEGDVPFFLAEYRVPGMGRRKHARAIVGGADPRRTLGVNVGDHQLVSLTELKPSKTEYFAEAA